MLRKDQFIHMTTSATLALMQHSDFRISSIHDLLYTHHLAPLSGEVACGGLTSAVFEKGTTAFAKVGDSYWDTESLKKYGQITYQQHYLSHAKFMDEVRATCKLNLNGILPLIIHILRDKQMRLFPALRAAEKAEMIALLQTTALTIKKNFIANYVVAKFLRSSCNSYASEENNIIYQFLKDLPAHLDENYLELSLEQQYNILSKMTLPASVTLQPGNAYSREKDSYSLLLLKNALRLATDMEFMNHWMFIESLPAMFKGVDPDCEKIHDIIAAGMRELSASIDLLTTMIADDAFGINFSDNELVTKSFRIAFVMESDELLKKLKYEFRATRSLKLGEDLHVISTDAEHVKDVEDYLKSANIDNVRVVPLSSLQPQQAHSFGLFPSAQPAAQPDQKRQFRPT